MRILHNSLPTGTAGDEVKLATMTATPPPDNKIRQTTVNEFTEITKDAAVSDTTTDPGLQENDLVTTTGCPQADPSSTEPPPPYSVFTTAEKKWISNTASFGAMFSTLSSYIYFPALVPMANDLGVSVSLINLTVTSYLIVAGIAPAFMGDLADQGGRRPAYILMFTLVATSNIGLALQNSYAALFVLRMVQSAGASGEWPRGIQDRGDANENRLIWRCIRNHC